MAVRRTYSKKYPAKLELKITATDVKAGGVYPPTRPTALAARRHFKLSEADRCNYGGTLGVQQKLDDDKTLIVVYEPYASTRKMLVEMRDQAKHKRGMVAIFRRIRHEELA